MTHVFDHIYTPSAIGVNSLEEYLEAIREDGYVITDLEELDVNGKPTGRRVLKLVKKGYQLKRSYDPSIPLKSNINFHIMYLIEKMVHEFNETLDRSGIWI